MNQLVAFPPSPFLGLQARRRKKLKRSFIWCNNEDAKLWGLKIRVPFEADSIQNLFHSPNSLPRHNLKEVVQIASNCIVLFYTQISVNLVRLIAHTNLVGWGLVTPKLASLSGHFRPLRAQVWCFETSLHTVFQCSIVFCGSQVSSCESQTSKIRRFQEIEVRQERQPLSIEEVFFSPQSAQHFLVEIASFVEHILASPFDSSNFRATSFALSWHHFPPWP